ncbi:hypothetical protein Fmac_017298 [Flemingia macrophylla]|uniref:Uncharacterized protein n=1 Tax=Flemingia macrophylla TaxID=520843 RepID=A0ABD1M260_9FABA
MLNEKRSLEELIDEGFVIIDELIQHSLLLLEDEYGIIKMHDLVRNMACHILNESHSCMVKCRQELIKIPNMREWTADLKIVSLADNDIKEIAEGRFLGRDNYNNYVRQTLNNDYEPKTYFIDFFEDEDYEYEDDDDDDYIMYEEFNRRRLYIGDCTELPYLLPRDLVNLTVHGNNKWEYLCAALSSKEPPPLKTIQINCCKVLKRLFCPANHCSTCTSIQSQHIADFRMLNHQTRMEVFCHLTHFGISRCNKIEMLLTPELVSSLGQLKSIEVWWLVV